MKLSKKIMILIFILIISLCTTTGFSFATNENNEEYKLNVMLKQDTNNEKVVHVILGMTDEDSIASFQIGLNINTTEEINVKFDFNTSLSENKHKESRISEISNSEGKKIKRLNIYYTGTKELNPAESNEIEIGTITLEGENKPNTTVKIEPVENFSTIESISHNDKQISVDTLSSIINKKENNDEGSGNSGNQGGNSNNENNGSSSQGSSSGDNVWSKPQGDNVSGSFENNSNNESPVKKFVNSIKTGANKSVTWAIITLIVLIIIAIIIIKLKKKQINTNKHISKH